jgi:2-polyprenyl-3-methyl-5-hydroxy-6-metoxy-1,4-benzoquinol methylase
MGNLNYLLRSAVKFADAAAWHCPNCGSVEHAELDRKYFVTRLLRCANCRLMFRSPTDSEEFNRRFYNFHYQQGTAMICPSDEAIAKLKVSHFAGTERDFSGYIDFLARNGVKPGGRVFDFGCSWGYGSYQLAKAGYDVRSYEIAVDRRTYAIEKLGIIHIDEPSAIVEGHPLAGSFDCFFSAHVLEHVPSPSKVIDLAWHCLRDGGVFVAFTPNGNDAFRRFNPGGWRNMWGNVHPNYLDDQFYNREFARSKCVFASQNGADVNRQYELGFVAIKNAAASSF